MGHDERVAAGRRGAAYYAEHLAFAKASDCLVKIFKQVTEKCRKK